MKKILKLTFILLIMLGSLNSCNSDETSSIFDENTVAERLSFVDVNSRIKNNKSLQSKIQTDIIIVTWDEWGRASKDCGGWGLCNADWFPSAQKGTFSKNNNNGGATILEFDSNTNKYYIDILLADSVPSDIPLNAITLKIDKDFELNVQEVISKRLTFNQGDYPFSTTLGEFGGYRIYLD